jgi:hypothetical protein
MSHATAKEADAGKAVVKVLEWPTPPDWTAFYPGWSYRQKLQWRSALSRELKEHLLVRLRQFPDVEVLNELVGTTQAIVCAPPETWDRLLDKADPIIPLDKIQIYDNDLVQGFEPVALTEC